VSAADPRETVPNVRDVYAETRATVLEAGIVEQSLKELCYRYLRADDAVVAHADDPERYSERERAALAWTYAIGWNDEAADEALWARLHAAFTDPELVELGYAIAFTLGQTHFLQTREGA
jgi:hypothetical protein